MHSKLRTADLLVSGSQAVIEGGGECTCPVALQIAAFSCIRIIVLFLLPVITSICIEYRKQLVDLPDSLVCDDMALCPAHTKNAPCYCYNSMDICCYKNA